MRRVAACCARVRRFFLFAMGVPFFFFRARARAEVVVLLELELRELEGLA